jgi:glycosyltransferase involved in cell wall biosynthesis
LNGAISHLSTERDTAARDVSGRLEACFIIPTFNRVEALKLCLAHLERQAFTDFEVVVVDDGSTDATSQFLEDYLPVTPLRLRVVRQENSGPARARNRAVAMAAAPLCIIIGDDILCSPQFAAVHVAFHRANPELKAAGLGFTVWSESQQTVTSFMRWMDESGSQFAYRDLLGGVSPEWRHFYTSNLSVKTQLLRENPFNERFTGAVWMMEDMELGYRLERRDSLRLVLLPDARAEHVHPTDFGKACRRAYGAGLSSRLFDELWPDRPVAVHGAIHRLVRDLLCRNSWLLGPVTRLTAVMTQVWCPNPLIHPVLAWHTAIARRLRR